MNKRKKKAGKRETDSEFNKEKKKFNLFMHFNSNYLSMSRLQKVLGG